MFIVSVVLTFSTNFDHFTLLFCRGRHKNVPMCKTHVQSVQSCCFCSLNRLFCGVLVAVRVKDGMSLRNGMWHDLWNGITMRNLIFAE